MSADTDVSNPSSRRRANPFDDMRRVRWMTHSLRADCGDGVQGALTIFIILRGA
ncbi:hypothetical protein [Xanthomonas fragariae]|uniref:hypothetical protein n=1 Tax=Xanthomonas fragariae TaxID=48664 RepID=UPI001ABE9B2A|nr:hypothetical protein [Xanthomonas fragariae]UKR52913.1 hypothetical protein K4A87_02150 [Xanthomonas fragariae]WAT15355.1 hypothetical protein OZ429_02325 [Xanthomonas fragariae]